VGVDEEREGPLIGAGVQQIRQEITGLKEGGELLYNFIARDFCLR
jgi:hypothetical protein